MKLVGIGCDKKVVSIEAFFEVLVDEDASSESTILPRQDAMFIYIYAHPASRRCCGGSQTSWSHELNSPLFGSPSGQQTSGSDIEESRTHFCTVKSGAQSKRGLYASQTFSGLNIPPSGHIAWGYVLIQRKSMEKDLWPTAIFHTCSCTPHTHSLLAIGV